MNEVVSYMKYQERKNVNAEFKGSKVKYNGYETPEMFTCAHG